MYTIHEVAEACNITAHTIRYYDKEGLLPFINRNSTGNRTFSENDLEVIKLICCLKNSGMPVKNIKEYMDLVMQGPDTASARRELLQNHRKAIQREIEDSKKNLNLVDLKIAFYDSYLAAPQAGYDPLKFMMEHKKP
ncbi:MerR family transcriptional regulator [Paenibacillus senegalimassiliensis]|uniref:MerR family transcriptional regulator n=1 Tax=Paenibacillus senegalimassiliensis TaxID=1737426 RepID=UPI00073EF511|nr:MerR family transcriptional regulator [Paenibacillus senegalimassiliensis]